MALFSPLWISHNDFMKIFFEAWTAPISGSPFYIWEEKLRRAKRMLKNWAKYLKTPNIKKNKKIKSC